MFGLGFGETILIFAVILLFFGPRRLPEAAQSLGKGIREFKRAVNGVGEEMFAPQNSIETHTPAPAVAAVTVTPPHATVVGPGADPHAVANAPEPAPAEQPPQ